MLVLLGFLESLQEMGFFGFQLLSNPLNIHRVVLLLLDPEIVAAPKRLNIQVIHSVEIRFGSIVVLSDPLILQLVVIHEALVVLLNKIVDSCLL